MAKEVTDEFTKKFPTAKWSIFVGTTAGITNKGVPYCSASAGVIPKGVDCARSGVNNTMSDDLSKICRPNV